MYKKTLLAMFVAIISVTSVGFSASAVHAEDGSSENAGARMEVRGTNLTSFGARFKAFLGIHDMRKENRLEGIRGTVTAVNGTTITLNAKTASTTVFTTYSIDASNSLFVKNKATSTTINVSVGDFVVAQGTLVDTNMTAKVVISGVPPVGQKQSDERREDKKEKKEEKREDKKESNEKNKKDVLKRMFDIRGVVTAVNGFALTVDGRGATSTATTTYSVDATNAKIFKDRATSTVSSIFVGDKVLVRGAVNETSVEATIIYDGKLPPMEMKKLSDEDGNSRMARPEAKFLNKIGAFFKEFFRFGR